MMKKILCVLMILLTSNPSHANQQKRSSFLKGTLVTFVTLLSMRQSEATPWYAWSDNVGGGNQEWGHALDLNSMGDYWLAGATSSYGHGGEDGFFLHYDATGQRMATYAFGDEEDNEIMGLKMDGENSFTAVGRTVISGKNHFLITHLNPEDNTGWQKAFGKDGDQQGEKVDTLPNGISVSVGHTNSSGGAGGIDMLAIKTDATGAFVYGVMIGSPGDDYAHSVKLLSDGRCVIVGATTTPTNGTDVALLMLDATGQNLVWDYTIGGLGEDIGYDLALSSTTFWWIGVTTSQGAGGKDILLGQHTLLGAPQRLYTIGGPGDEVGKSMDIAPNGEITIAAEMESFGSGGKDLYVAILNATGALKKANSKVIGGGAHEYVGAVRFTPDQKSAAIGSSQSYNGNQDLLFAKVRYGHVDCGSLVTPKQSEVTALFSWQNASFSKSIFNGTWTDPALDLNQLSLDQDPVCTISKGDIMPTLSPTISPTAGPLFLFEQQPDTSLAPTSAIDICSSAAEVCSDTAETCSEPDDLFFAVSTVLGSMSVFLGIFCWGSYWICFYREARRLHNAEHKLDEVTEVTERQSLTKKQRA